MAVKKSKKCFGVVICSYFKDRALQQFKRDEKCLTRCVKGVPLFNKRVSFSVKNGTWKGKGSDLEGEHPREKLCRVTHWASCKNLIPALSTLEDQFWDKETDCFLLFKGQLWLEPSLQDTLLECSGSLPPLFLPPPPYSWERQQASWNLLLAITNSWHFGGY